MKFLTRISLSLLALPVSAFATNAVVNMSHYDLMRADFGRMKYEGIVGVIHEATYPAFVRDSYYASRQQAATRAGLLWGAYHYANSGDPVRQADHFLNVVKSAWSQADPASRPSGILLVLDFEKNGHYPGGSMRIDQAVAFAERIKERTGKYPGIYSGEYHIRQAVNGRRLSAAQRIPWRTAGCGWPITARVRARRRPGVIGISGNTPVMANAVCRARATQKAWPTSSGPSAIFSTEVCPP